MRAEQPRRAMGSQATAQAECVRDESGTAEADGKRNLKERALGELEKYAVIAVYLWLLFALGCTIAKTATIINLIGRIAEIQEATRQTTTWQQLVLEASVRRLALVSFLFELASLGLWLAFAHAWSKASPNRSAGLRYTVNCSIEGVAQACVERPSVDIVAEPVITAHEAKPPGIQDDAGDAAADLTERTDTRGEYRDRDAAR